MLIYKVFRSAEWAEFMSAGVTFGAPVDLTDGFLHFSTAAQLGETLNRHFFGEAGLQLVAVDAGAVGYALHWEESRGGDFFPHLYRPLRMDEVVWSHPLEGLESLPEVFA